MKFTKRNSVAIFILALFLLLVSSLFNGSITGNAVLSAEVLNLPLHNYLILFLTAVCLAGAIGAFLLGGIEHKVEEELHKFKADIPNSSKADLTAYIDYCRAQGKKDIDIKNSLIRAKWDENLINGAFENLNAKT